MKYFILPLALIFSIELTAQSSVYGKINNLNNLNDSMFKVVFIQNKVRKDSTFSRTAGFYSQKIKSGTYDIELSKKNYIPVVLRAVFINTGNTSINFSVKFNMPKSDVVDKTSGNKNIKTTDAAVSYDSAVKTSGSSGRGAGSGDAVSFSGAVVSEKRSYAKMLKPTSTTTSKSTTTGSPKSDYSPKRKGEVYKGLDKESPLKESEETPPETVKDEPVKSDVKAGQVTAGHWRDIDHWTEWEETNKNAGILNFQQLWGYYPRTMMKVSFEDRDQHALAFTSVALLDRDNQIIWQTKTDQDGQAWFWPDMFVTHENKKYKIRVKKDGMEKIIDNIQPYINSKNKLKVDFINKNEKLLEIGFVVDATGSMGDEIKFLQVDLMDVINRVQKKNRCLNVQTGCVFYKDHGDDYLTRVLPLSANPANTINFIGYQAANGGGDFPEAIDIALQDAITQLKWSNSDNPKIMFLLLDAPPHQDSGSKARMRSYTSMAAEKGIRIVPIAASGIDKTTEFLLKYLAIATNGEYVYITDDSKIGDTHLKPTGGESKVTYLNDLIVNIINQYSEGKWCREENPIDSTLTSEKIDTLSNVDSSQRQNNTEIIAGNNWYMKFYPNPAAYILQIDFSEVAERIKITDINGKVMYEVENKDHTNLSIDISSWNTGIYIVYAVKSDETISGKLLVMH